MSTKALNKRRYYWLKARGLCIACAGPKETKKVRCNACHMDMLLTHVPGDELPPEPKHDVPRCPRCFLASNEPTDHDCLKPIEFYATSRRNDGTAARAPGLRVRG